MQTENDYRPAVINFCTDTDESNMPEDFGVFDNIEQCMKFMHSHVTGVGEPITVSRHMDHVEKRLIRERYNEVLEDVLPIHERELSEANQRLAEAKKNAKEAEERVNASVSEVKILSKEVKRGTKEINLDDLATLRIPFRGRYYYYTFMDGVMKLCKIKDVPDHEKQDLYNAMAENETFIDEQFGDGTEPKRLMQISGSKENEQTETQTGQEE